MAALPITDSQAAIVNAFKSKLENAFAEGVSAAVQIIGPIEGYSNFDIATRELAKLPMNSLISAFIKELNLLNALPTGLTATVTLAKLTPGGTDGSLTFTDGILTAKVDPT